MVNMIGDVHSKGEAPDKDLQGLRPQECNAAGNVWRVVHESMGGGDTNNRRCKPFHEYIPHV